MPFDTYLLYLAVILIAAGLGGKIAERRPQASRVSKRIAERRSVTPHSTKEAWGRIRAAAFAALPRLPIVGASSAALRPVPVIAAEHPLHCAERIGLIADILISLFSVPEGAAAASEERIISSIASGRATPASSRSCAAPTPRGAVTMFFSGAKRRGYSDGEGEASSVLERAPLLPASAACV